MIKDNKGTPTTKIINANQNQLKNKETIRNAKAKDPNDTKVIKKYNLKADPG